MRAAALPLALLAVGLGACGDGLEAQPAGPFARALRPDDPASQDLFRFDPGDVVLAHDSPAGGFRVHYAEAGTHAVPAADADASGVPDFVELVATTYDEVLDHYSVALGFAAPLSDASLSSARNGGDGRFDVYLLDFALQSDGAFQLDACLVEAPARCLGYIVQENDFAGYGYPSRAVAVRTLASHELFHAVQAAYDVEQGSVLAEGTAVWATESFDASLDDLEWLVAGYLSEPWRSLDLPPPGPVQPFTYGSAIFFRFLEERFGGAAVLRELWELLPDGARGVADPYWLTELDLYLAREHASSFAEAFLEFATWNLSTGRRAQPGVGYAEAARYPELALTPATAPLTVETPRLFYASTRYWALSPDTRSGVTAALVGDEAQLAGLRLLVAVERGAGYDEVIELGELAAGTRVVDTGGATSVVVAVVNTAREGTSRRPSLCAGTPTEVAACRRALTPAPPPGDGDGDDEDGAGGCAATPGGAWAVLVVLALRRRSRCRT